MAQILLKNTAQSGSIPTHLAQGEIGINTTDGKIYYSDGAANNIKQFGVSSSFASQAESSSYALTASYALNGGGGGGTPGGSTTQIQYNNVGTFAGVPTLTYDGTTLTATGSFTGSFTGSLFGTSSFAQTASFATSASWAPLNAGGLDTQIQFNSGSKLVGTGSFTFNYQSQSLLQGFAVTASGLYSHAQGSNTVASGYASHAEGVGNQAIGTGSHAEGTGVIAKGQYSHAEGKDTTTLGSYSHAEGISNLTPGPYSHAEGESTYAVGYGSHTEGNKTLTLGYITTVRGNTMNVNTATIPDVDATSYFSVGNYVVVLNTSYTYVGSFVISSVNYSYPDTEVTFEGYKDSPVGFLASTSTPSYSHAEGYGTIASGYASHAEGQETIASGSYSHAEGSGSIAIGIGSHAGGIGTIASADYQTVIGQYNEVNGESINKLFVIGNGRDDLGRSNVVEVAIDSVYVNAPLFADVTGNLTGNASYAYTSNSASYALSSSKAVSSSFATTASYAANGGVTQIIAGTNITVSPANGLGQVIINSSGGGGSTFPYSGSAVITGSLLVSGSITGSLLGTSSYALTASYALNSGGANYNTMTGSYGSFYDTGSVLATSATQIYSMSLSTTDISNGVFVSASAGDRTRIKFTNAGIYNVQFSAQFSNTDNSTQDTVVWVRKNGTDIPDSSGTVGVPPFKAGSNGQALASWNYYLNLSANDYVQLCWHVEQANVITLETIAAGTSPTHPRTPSLILTAQRVDTFLSNTGSFSGSFTGEFSGSLFGTSSWAVSASNALTASFVSGSIFTNSNSAASASFAQTASYVLNAISASWAPVPVSASYATTASYVQNAQSASYVLQAVSSSFASTASFAPNYQLTSGTGSMLAPYVLTSVTSSMSVATASYIQNAQSASYILQAVSASFAVSASRAVTASYAMNAGSGGTNLGLVQAMTVGLQNIF